MCTQASLANPTPPRPPAPAALGVARSVTGDAFGGLYTPRDQGVGVGVGVDSGDRVRVCVAGVSE